MKYHSVNKNTANIYNWNTNCFKCNKNETNSDILKFSTKVVLWFQQNKTLEKIFSNWIKK